jgi:hypothetical protein
VPTRKTKRRSGVAPPGPAAPEPARPLPLLYISNGDATTLTDLFDQKRKSRRIFQAERLASCTCLT